MATLVFDIETIGEPWESFDATTKKTLTRWIEKTTRTGEEYEHELENVKAQLGFSPLTGSVIALGVYDLERCQGAVYYVGDGSREIFTEGDITYKERSEAELLRDFWDGASRYDTFVTFNGRSFDVPFLLHRSVVHGIRPTVDLLGQRYLTRQTVPYHIDLQDELTFYGAMYRRAPLHLFCRAYGIESPKGEVSGDEVAELFLAKKFRDLARYNARDILATAALYEKWKDHLAPASFINSIEF
ncbi:MAG TPA: ribonuclease H-like domain-containing protein [Candidatus Paceibacterota bacterium]